MLAGTMITGFAVPALAQEASDTDAQPGTDVADGQASDGKEGNPASDGIVVTGSRIKGVQAIGNVIMLDRTIIEETGVVDLGEAIRQLPQNFSGGQNPGVGSGGGVLNQNVNAASQPNLRGLGADATLTLLNGHRLPYDSAFAGVDISAIPLAAVERIEVLPDGASALYGSDAVAGVINVILRRDFEGITTSAQLGSSTQGGNFRQQFDVVGGTTWAGGGLVASYDFSNNSAVRASQRSFSSPLNPETNLFPRQRRHAATVSAYQALSPDIEFSLDALYSNRRSTLQGGVPTSFQVQRPELESFSIAPSIRINIGPKWQASVVGVVGQDETRIDSEFLNRGTQFARTVGCICNDLFSVEANAEGPLFALPGGEARLALGAGFRRNGFEQTLVRSGTPVLSYEADQEATFVYGEVVLPFIGPENGIAGISELTLIAAVRNEDFKDVEAFAAPRIGVRYSPARSVILTGNWSRSFKAPTLFQRFTPFETFVLGADIFGAGSGDETVFVTSGGNPDLGAEKARSWTAGIEIRPEAIAGLTVSATWYDIRFSDRVVRPIPGSVVAAFNNPGFASVIDFSPDLALLEDLIANSLFGLENFSDVPYDPANVVAFIDNRNTNVSAWTIEGIDARVAWNRELGDRRSFGIELSGTYLDTKQRVVPGLPEVQLSGTVFSPPRYRARGLARYEAGPLRGNIAVNYIGALDDPRFATAARLSPSATVDLGITYDIVEGQGRDPGLSVSLTVQNLFDFEPARIRGLGPTDTPFDSTNYSAIGRFVAFGIRRHW
jgi:outer membrane receptor protein involved in Fe transport